MSHAEPYGIRRALNELEAIFEAQWSNGMLPHIRFFPGVTGYRPNPEDWGVTAEISGQDRVATSGITQPPIMGWCAREVFRRLSDPAPYLDEFLALAQGIERFHHFLLTERDPAGDGLALCLHSWETGTDNSPAFEPLLAGTRAYLAEHQIPIDRFGRADTHYVPMQHRPTDENYTAFFGLMALFRRCRYDQACIAETSPFLAQDVLFNSLLVESLLALADLQDSLAALADSDVSLDRAASASGLRRRASKNRATALRVTEAIRSLLWSDADGLYYVRDARRGELIRVPTVSSLMPLLAGIATPEQAAWLIEHLHNPAEFATPYPVPSTALNYREFDPLRYWTGPSWPVPNWLLVRALAGRQPEMSESLRRSTLAMIAEGMTDLGLAAERAGQAMAGNSVEERTTTPSRGQYQHAWLWDSAIAAVGWTALEHAPEPLPAGADGPGFWEYYHPLTGAPLGAPLMTWTAAVFLDLLRGPKGS